MELVESRNFENGVVLLIYKPRSEAPVSRYVEEYAWTDEQVRAFEAEENVNRVLATVMFTDIVGSSGRAACSSACPSVRSTRGSNAAKASSRCSTPPIRGGLPSTRSRARFPTRASGGTRRA